MKLLNNIDFWQNIAILFLCLSHGFSLLMHALHNKRLTTNANEILKVYGFIIRERIEEITKLEAQEKLEREP